MTQCQAWQDECIDSGKGLSGGLGECYGDHRATGLTLNGEGQTCYVFMTVKKRALKHAKSGFLGDVAMRERLRGDQLLFADVGGQMGQEPAEDSHMCEAADV